MKVVTGVYMCQEHLPQQYGTHFAHHKFIIAWLKLKGAEIVIFRPVLAATSK